MAQVSLNSFSLYDFIDTLTCQCSLWKQKHSQHRDRFVGGDAEFYICRINASFIAIGYGLTSGLVVLHKLTSGTPKGPAESKELPFLC